MLAPSLAEGSVTPRDCGWQGVALSDGHDERDALSAAWCTARRLDVWWWRRSPLMGVVMAAPSTWRSTWRGGSLCLQRWLSRYGTLAAPSCRDGQRVAGVRVPHITLLVAQLSRGGLRSSL